MAAVFTMAPSAAAWTPPVDMEFVLVPGDVYSGGPVADYRISRFEVRNDQFVPFLNDALANLDNERGYFLYFDLDGGDVYIHSAQTGTTGTNGSGTLIFDASADPFVSYDNSLGEYVLEPDGEDHNGEGHPVAGVSWYGAVKFCNWLTIATGLAPDERAYSEAPSSNLEGWHPVTTTDAQWAVGDLTDQQREALLAKLGFRLPMDGGDGGNPGPYNEWYKAAAWDPVAGVHRVYGFGRDVLTDADANFLGSGDPFEPGTSPVGFFDGLNLLADGTTFTVDTDNAYGLYDCSGNVWEWMQDQSPSDPAKRRFRGGSYENVEMLLEVVWPFSGQAHDADANKGFRVLQSLPDDFFVTDSEVQIAGPWGGPFEEPYPSGVFSFTIHNTTDSNMLFDVTEDAIWIELIGSPYVEVPAQGTAVVEAAVVSACGGDGLTVGENLALLTFDPSDGPPIGRPVTLTITEPVTMSEGGFHATMLFGSVPVPAQAIYTLTSVSATAVGWTASIDPPDTDWLSIPALAGEILPQGQDSVTVQIVQPDTGPLPPGTYLATLIVTDDCTGETFERPVSLAVGVTFSVVPGDEDSQGPVTEYRISRFEVSNDQFVPFLNDALVNLDNERGYFLYFDLDSGRVYIHSSQTGTTGTNGSGTLIFDASADPFVSYDDSLGEYVLEPDGEGHNGEGHPVAGVSWYGAVKFCNWLTIVTGLAPDERAYSEAPRSNLEGWHPVTTTDAEWAVGDLTDQQRDELLGKLGFRLPMDGGDGGNPGPYNEWYKAAAWDPANGVHRVYGFGRDELNPADANYKCSGDPFEDPDDCNVGGTTPAGFYDGTSLLADGTPTVDTYNAYRLYDCSGNVWEWVQDQSPSDPAKRRFRGGSWESDPALPVDQAFAGQAGDAEDNKGFRVVQRVADGFFVTDHEVLIAGVWGGPFEEPHQSGVFTFKIHNASTSVMTFGIAEDAAWVELLDPNDVTVPAGGTVSVDVRIVTDCESDGLVVGDNVATFTFNRVSDQLTVERLVTLTITEPLDVDGDNLHATMQFASEPTPTETTYTLSNESETAVRWTASPEFDPPETQWLLISPEPDEEVLPLDETTLRVEIDQSAIVTLAPGTYEATISISDVCTGEVFERPASLVVGVPYTIDHEGGAQWIGIWGGSFFPTEHLFEIASATDVPVDWSVELEFPDPDPATDWMELDTTSGSLDDETPAVTITASLTAAATSLEPGTHEVTLRFIEATTLYEIERTVTLEVVDFVIPDDGVRFSGPLGGPFAPSGFTYTLQNLEPFDEIPILIEVTYDPVGVEWLDVASVLELLSDPPDDAVSIPIILAPVAETLDEGTYRGELTFERLDPSGAVSVRVITLEIAAEAFAVAMANIPAEHIQPLGPQHLFRISKYEVTNAEFVRFLNDAIDNPDNEHGQYMNHDTAAGTVNLVGDSTPLFDANLGGAIGFDGSQYVVLEDKEDLPVVGVSWYGALKFCNWMTLIQGMHVDQRAYNEGPNSQDWHPDTISTSDWEARDLTDSERLELVAGYRGFRLPMDHQAEQVASLYNEWYKAAAWQEGPRENRLYGFGRDELTDADANFLDSGDPFESDDPPVSPVGFFNGVNLLSGGELTNSTANGYGLYDLTGNVAEWLQDWGDSSSDRVTRGGHFHNTQDSSYLKTQSRWSRPAGSTLPTVGFRVLQVFEPVELEVTLEPVRIDRPVGGAFGPPDTDMHYTLRIENPSDVQTVDDITIELNASWLEIDGVPPQQVQPLGLVEVDVQPTTDPAVIGVSPAPSGDYALVRGSDAPVDGPAYDYWIGRREVTNSQFAVFLNEARSNAGDDPPDERSEYMYFDLDSGSVYINDQQAGEEGTEPPLDYLLYDAAVGRIHLLDDDYIVDEGFDSHPVVGVTWFGAVKYCNWLTIWTGIPADLRAYSEAPSPDLDGWRPVTAEAWEPGQFSDIQRNELISTTMGYRLPMDDEAGSESAYNEWYNAAAWDPVDELHRDYGFGRNGLDKADANYLDSEDTELDGTTPIRFFNGGNVLFGEVSVCPAVPPDVTTTEDTDNSYGLYDACGNVAEWTQEFGDTSTERATRGGSWRDEQLSAMLSNDGRGSREADLPTDDVGFRVVRGTGRIATVTVTDHQNDVVYKRYLVLDLREPFHVEPRTHLEDSWVYGGTSSAEWDHYTLTNESASPMDWKVSVSEDWAAAETEGGYTEGEIEEGESLSIYVELDSSTAQLAPGTYEAAIAFRNVTTGTSQVRSATLTIAQPISVAACESDPDPYVFSGVWGGPFETTGPCEYELRNEVGFDLEYDVEVDQPWITIESVGGLTGPLPPDAVVGFEVAPNEAANALDVGEHEATISFGFIDPANGNLSSSIDQTVTLIVEDPIAIDPDDPWIPDPDDPEASQLFILSNHYSTSIDVSVGVDVDWLELDVTELEVVPGGQQALVTVSLTDLVHSLPYGEYFAAVTFDDTVTGYQQCRTVTVTINENLFVSPYDGFVASGIAGGPIGPTFKTYTLTNAGDAGPLDWNVTVYTDIPGDPVDWIGVSGADTSLDVDVGESVMILISIITSETDGLEEGVHEATVEFTAGQEPETETVTRVVSLTLVVPHVDDLAEAPISAAALQLGGPMYSFLMNRHLTTNSQFVRFLNDAVNNFDNERGQYMFVDRNTGDVYINYTLMGDADYGPGPRTKRMFSPEASGRIVYFDDPPSYGVLTDPLDYSQHPVTNVTWYGALKFCNWLTLDQGMLSSERCYTEATDTNYAQGWHPVTISTSDWEVRDLTDAERLELVTNYRGYRLPMDDGFDNSHPSTDMPDAYNEWYKAAAWNDTLQENTIYGFGRDEIEGADANFECSGDPFEDAGDCTLGGTSPVGFFDGTVYNSDGIPDEGDFETAPDGNGFGLFDMTGNVHQWIQGYWRPPVDPVYADRRTLRGGGWDMPGGASSLQTASRPLYTAPDGTYDLQAVGFRVVRTLREATGDADHDGDVDADDFGEFATHFSGPGGGVLPEWTVFDFDTDGDIDMGDFAVFQEIFQGPL